MPTLPRIGINIADYPYHGTCFPFTNLARMGSWWFSDPDRTKTIELTESGYPTRLEPNQTALMLLYTNNGGIYPTGTYTLAWSGSGKVELQGHNVSLLSTNVGNVRIYNVATTNPNGLIIKIITTDPKNPVHNISLVASSIPSHVNGFNKDWLEATKIYGVARHLGWMMTNSSPISKWKDRPRLSDAHTGKKGIPLETIISLANTQRHDIWLPIPHQADDEYCRKTAELIDHHLDHGLRVWVEYSNEVWNGMFYQCLYAQQVLVPRYNNTLNFIQAYGRRSREIHDIFESVLRRPRIVKVLSGAAANTGTLNYAISGYGTGFDCLAIAPYFSADLNPLYAQYKAGTVDLDSFFAILRTNVTLSITADYMARCRKIAAEQNVPLVCYEAGQHLLAINPTQQNDAGFTELLKTINRDPRMGECYTQYLNSWYASGGSTMCLLSDVSPYTKHGYWGLQEHWLDTNAAKYQAVQAYFSQE